MDVRARLEALSAAHLEALLARIEEAAREAVPAGSTLVEMLGYHMGTGGKRLRALLPLAVADALGARPVDLLPFGAACELLHNATLVHDDLQDGDRLRRDQPTVWVEYGAPQAINLGDAMLYVTLSLVHRLEGSFELGAMLRAERRLLRETLRVIDGQEREFALQQQETPSSADYVRMVEGKTSGLFALPLAGAAELVGAEAEVVEALARAAGELGVIFQLQDDILDLWGDKGRGEVQGSDLGEGKISGLVVEALQRTAPEEARWLRDLLWAEREALTPADVARARELFEGCGALGWAFDEIERRRKLALGQRALAGHEPLLALLRGVVEVFLEPIRPLVEAQRQQQRP